VLRSSGLRAVACCPPNLQHARATFPYDVRTRTHRALAVRLCRAKHVALSSEGHCEVKGGKIIGGQACAGLPRWCSTLVFRSLLPRFYIAVRRTAAMLHQAFQDLHHRRVVRRRRLCSSSPATTGLHRAYLLHSGVKLHPDPTSSEMSTMEGSWALLNLRYKRGPSIPAYRTPIYGDLLHGGGGDVSSDLCCDVCFAFSFVVTRIGLDEHVSSAPVRTGLGLLLPPSMKVL
jgi:hypothetical protein